MIALLRTLYLFLVGGLSALFLIAFALPIRWRMRHEKVLREFEEFIREFHLSYEDALALIAKERATHLIEEELVARGRAMAPGRPFFSTKSRKLALQFSRRGFGIEHRADHSYMITTPRHLS